MLLCDVQTERYTLAIALIGYRVAICHSPVEIIEFLNWTFSGITNMANNK